MPTIRNYSRQKIGFSRSPRHPVGLRRLRVWVPDTRPRSFAATIRRQCLALKTDHRETDAARFGEVAASLIKGWE